MSDEAKVPPLPESTEVLQILVEGKKATLKLTDRDGKVHDCPALRAADIMEFERHAGTTVLGFNPRTQKFADICFMLYLSLRREGKSREELEKKIYAYTEDQVYDMFDAGLWEHASELWVGLMAVSGFELRPQKASQEKTAAPAAQTQA